MPQSAPPASSPPAPAPGQGRFALIVTLSIQMLAAWASLTGPVLAPLAAGDIGVGPYLVGIYVSVSYAFGASAALVSGGFIARLGPLRVSQLSLVLCGAGLALTTLGTPLAVLAAAAVVGIGYGPITPASSHILARTTPPARMNLVFSIKQTGVPLGNALAGAVAPGLAALLGWRGAALATAALCLVVAAASEPLRSGLDIERERRRPLLSLAHVVGPFRLVFRSPELRKLSLVSFAFAGMQTSLGTFLVTYLNGRLGMSVVLAGVVLAVAQGAGVIGRPLWGLIADRFVSPIRLLGILGVTMALSAVLVGLFTASWPFIAILAVSTAYGGTAVAWNGVHLAQVARYSPPGRAGEVTGGASFVTFAGVVVVPALFSAILGSLGSYMVAFNAVAALALASGLALLFRLGSR
ncbi:MAG: MFS transporter [Alphaproteobacteria bacterium]